MQAGSEAVYRFLTRRIERGEMRPGTSLRLQEIALALRVSPIPVREALARLVGEGVIAHDGRRGYGIATGDPTTLSSIYRLSYCLAEEARRRLARPPCRPSASTSVPLDGLPPILVYPAMLGDGPLFAAARRSYLQMACYRSGEQMLRIEDEGHVEDVIQPRLGVEGRKWLRRFLAIRLRHATAIWELSRQPPNISRI